MSRQRIGPPRRLVAELLDVLQREGPSQQRCMADFDRMEAQLREALRESPKKRSEKDRESRPASPQHHHREGKRTGVDATHPDGLTRAKALATRGLCLFCEEPVGRGGLMCGSEGCRAAYYRAWHRDARVRHPERYGHLFRKARKAVSQ